MSRDKNESGHDVYMRGGSRPNSDGVQQQGWDIAHQRMYGGGDPVAPGGKAGPFKAAFCFMVLGLAIWNIWIGPALDARKAAEARGDMLPLRGAQIASPVRPQAPPTRPAHLKRQE
jgi:hypothetical protein